MQFWYLVNPLCNKQEIQSKVVGVFLHLVYDPYMDNDQKSFDELVQHTNTLVDEIKTMMIEQEQAYMTEEAITETLQTKEKIEGLWLAGDLIKELGELTDNFEAFKRGLVKVPKLKDR